MKGLSVLLRRFVVPATDYDTIFVPTLRNVDEQTHFTRCHLVVFLSIEFPSCIQQNKTYTV